MPVAQPANPAQQQSNVEMADANKEPELPGFGAITPSTLRNKNKTAKAKE